MQTRTHAPASALALAAALSMAAGHATAQQPSGWKQHDMSRPRPPVVAPAQQTLPAPPPADAVVLFNGTDLAAWESARGGAAPWTVENGAFVVRPGSGGIRTRESFGDVQLHVEWASPSPPRGTGQDRGNSGVFLMGRYEVQVLDVHNAETYADGQAAAIYGQYPPLFNVTRAPGEWQSYDIYFRRPRFGPGGQLVEPARVTVVHNGILVQNNEQILGPTSWMQYSPYQAHADAAPLELQDHGHPVRFRNIWVRRIPERPAPTPEYTVRGVQLSPQQMERYVGSYARAQGSQTTPLVRVFRQGDQLMADINTHSPQQLTAVSPTEFALAHTGGRLVFELDAQGRPTGVVFHMGGAEMRGRRAP